MSRESSLWTWAPRGSSWRVWVHSSLGAAFWGCWRCWGAGKEALMCLGLHSALLLLWKGNFVPDSKHCIWTVEKPRASPSGVRGAFGTNVKGMWAHWSSCMWGAESWGLHFIFKHLGSSLLQELTAVHSIKGPNSLWHAFFSLGFKT